MPPMYRTRTRGSICISRGYNTTAMCGRYSPIARMSALRSRFRFDGSDSRAPSYNLAPALGVLAVMDGEPGRSGPTRSELTHRLDQEPNLVASSGSTLGPRRSQNGPPPALRSDGRNVGPGQRFPTVEARWHRKRFPDLGHEETL